MKHHTFLLSCAQRRAAEGHFWSCAQRRAAEVIALALLFLLSPLCAHAFDYASTESTKETSAQIRAGFDFTKKWDNGLRLGVGEEIYVDLYNSTTGTNFSKSYTTLSLGYAPIKYLKFDAGYTMRILGNKDWSDYNEWLRHRTFLSLTGSAKIGRVKLSLRERVMADIRTDSLNVLEKNQCNWLLRSKLTAEYSFRSKPLKPYISLELVNTLNVPEYQKKYKDNDPTNPGHQYITDVRATLGLKYKLNKQNSLNFFYRFNYGYDRDINITKKKSLIELTEERSYLHAISVYYEFSL